MEAELKEKGFSVHTDKTKFDFEVIHGFLKHSYWAKDVPIEIIKKSIDNSLCFGVFHKEKQIGLRALLQIIPHLRMLQMCLYWKLLERWVYQSYL
jgi:hypothetical protein